METQKLTDLAFELESMAIRLESQHHAPIDSVLALYELVRQLRDITKEVELYRRKV